VPDITRKLVDHILVLDVGRGYDVRRVDVAVGVEHARSNHLVKLVVVQRALVDRKKH
jgi:hypothetical protein